MRRAVREGLDRGQHGALGLILVGVVTLLAGLGVEPIPTYYFVLAWYPLLLAADGCVKRRTGSSLLVDRPLALLCLFGWSVPFWLAFEALNFRVENWYYVNAPQDPLAARALLLLSFATVLPALVLAFQTISSLGWFAAARGPRIPVSKTLPRRLAIAGVAMLLLVLAWPTYAYPLVWCFAVLLLEPFNRRPGWPSLLRDLERGHYERLLRLLAAGALCGVAWELMNVPAQARWIYTIPFFDRTVGLEMPPLGFLGFLPFALEAYAFLRALEILGLSVPFEAPAERGRVTVEVAPIARLLVLPSAIATLSFLVVVGIEQRTVQSYEPFVEDLAGATPRVAAVLHLTGIERARELNRFVQDPDRRKQLEQALELPGDAFDRLLQESALATHRGIGAANARWLLSHGIQSVADLARADAADVIAQLRSDARAVPASHVRGWIRAARSP